LPTGLLIYFGYRAVGYHSPENFPFVSIFGVAGQNVRLRATYHYEELKYLYRLLKNFLCPETQIYLPPLAGSTLPGITAP
jgi:hypothetical protein